MPFLVIVEANGLDFDLDSKFLGQPCQPRVGTVFELPAVELRVGRRPGNDLVLRSPSVSSFHLRLFREGDQYVYEDIGSRQMPHYNGKPMLSDSHRRVMKDGDMFNAAGVFFRYLESVPTDLVCQG